MGGAEPRQRDLPFCLCCVMILPPRLLMDWDTPREPAWPLRCVPQCLVGAWHRVGALDERRTSTAGPDEEVTWALE